MSVTALSTRIQFLAPRTVSFVLFAGPARRRRTQHRSKSSILRITQADADSDRLRKLLDRLRKIDTSALCDADKALLANSSTGVAGLDGYVGLRLMEASMKPRNYRPYASDASSDPDRDRSGKANSGSPAHHLPDMGLRMVGLARTVQCTRPNDFFALICGLDACKAGDVLVVNTLDSKRAVAGGIFLSEASRRRMGGIIVDGPVRDVVQLAEVRDLLVYSTSVTPYSGTVQEVGKIDVPVKCGGVQVNPGDVVVGDGDGVVVGSLDTFEAVVESAENIIAVEQLILRGIRQGHSLHSMMNYKEHLEARSKGSKSVVVFKDTRLISFQGVKPVDYR